MFDTGLVHPGTQGDESFAWRCCLGGCGKIAISGGSKRSFDSLPIDISGFVRLFAWLLYIRLYWIVPLKNNGLLNIMQPIKKNKNKKTHTLEYTPVSVSPSQRQNMWVDPSHGFCCWELSRHVKTFLQHNHESVTDWWFGTCFFFFHILGISSSQLTFIFFKMVSQPPTRSSRQVRSSSCFEYTDAWLRRWSPS